MDGQARDGTSQGTLSVMRKAVIYARVSSTSDRQSTARQVSDLRAYADREGLEIVKVFQEKGSGAKEDRHVLQKCISFCEEQNTELLVSEVSRLGLWFAFRFFNFTDIHNLSGFIELLSLSCDLLSDFLTLRIYTTWALSQSNGVLLWFAFRFVNFTDIHNHETAQLKDERRCDLLSDFLTLRIYTTAPEETFTRCLVVICFQIF